MMSPQGGDRVGSQLQRSLDLLHQLYLVEAPRRPPQLQAMVDKAFQSARLTPAPDTLTVGG